MSRVESRLTESLPLRRGVITIISGTGRNIVIGLIVVRNAVLQHRKFRPVREHFGEFIECGMCGRTFRLNRIK